MFKEFHFKLQDSLVRGALPGPKSQVLLKKQKKLEGAVVSYPVKMPIALKKGLGCVLEDVDGNQFLDFFAGCGVLNVGHSNPYVLEYVEQQQKELVHALDFPTENKGQMIEMVLERLPEALQKEYKVSFGGPTGSDAVEAAIKLAKIHTGREGILAFSGGYHGMTSGALAVTADTGFKAKFTGLMPNVSFVPYGYCYRCPQKKSPSSCHFECVDTFEWMLKNTHSGIKKPAAIIIESLQGEGGNITPKQGYLEKVINLCKEEGILVIVDEIQSGFYRTGKFLGFMNEAVAPDIITFSKGFGGIGFPLSGLIYRKEVESWSAGDHIGTFRANQVGVASARGALDFIQEFQMESHVKEIGAYFMDALEQLQTEVKYIGDVRGQGLMIGVEFVKDRETKEPFPEYVAKLRQECFQKGLLFEVGGHYSNVIRFVPPLTMTQEHVNRAMEILKEACDGLR